jgi:flagellar basal-body rod protein FlgG
VPEGAIVGLGVKTAAVRNLHLRRASLTQHRATAFDLALVGRGWFQIEAPDGSTLYTRAGAFNTNAQGPARHASTATRSCPASPCRRSVRLEVSR